MPLYGIPLYGIVVAMPRRIALVVLPLVLGCPSESSAPDPVGAPGSVDAVDVAPTADIPDTLAPPTDHGAPGDMDPGSADAPIDTPTDAAVAEDTPETDGPGCLCPESQYCQEGGGCAPDVCLQGQSTCGSLDAVHACNEDGSDYAVVACGDDQICYLGACQAPVCSPEDPPFCEDGMRMVCNSLGLAWVPVPCPGGSGCQAGECVPIRPNVIVIVDTSGSMSLLYDQDDTYPSECKGEDWCPPWTFPECDAPDAPLTRIGRTKVALQQIFASEETTGSAEAPGKVRLALQRFPQIGTKSPDCKHGYYQDKTSMTGDVGAHSATGAWFEKNLAQILAVPFSVTGETNDVPHLVSWVDFEETLATGGQALCNTNSSCLSNVCVGGACQEHTNPELRGIGATPLGKSLFYAGEYLRRLVLVEGRPCQLDADCGSPHHTCVMGEEGAGGTCHDPFAACRPSAIVLFTDGVETVHDDPQTFFHPWTQAKRLHYGLGCKIEAHCLNGATCVDERCEPPNAAEIPKKQCNALAVDCTSDAECPAFNCGMPDPCPGECEVTDVTYIDTQGSNHLKGYDGAAIGVTVHVVDASGFAASNALIALWGGGEHVPVDFDDMDGLVAKLAGLLDVKVEGTCGE